MIDPHYPARRPSPLPLILAGAALALTVWLTWDRLRPVARHVDAEPRAIEPRGELADFEKAAIAIFEANAPSVVHITSPEVEVYSTDGWRRSYRGTLPEGTGTGFVWDERGYLVTNYHVVGVRDRVSVRLHDLRTHDAVVVGTEPEQDIAVLRLAEEVPGLRPIPIGESHDLTVGQSVFAIGNPFGLDHSLSTGVISALHREMESPSRTRIRGVIQVDAAINPGNSGGPLLDSAGRLIGMNTAIYSPSGASAGIGFAVPVDTINRVVPRLIRGGEEPRVVADHPALGVEIDDQRIGGRRWPMVLKVFADTGAARAGLLGPRLDGRRLVLGDLIVAIDGRAVASREELKDYLATRRVGDRVTLTLVRGLPYASEQLEIDVPLELSVSALDARGGSATPVDRGR